MPLSWVEMHGAVTHLPVAFLLAMPLFDAGALLLGRPEWRRVSFWFLAASVVLLAPALLTGWMAGADLFGGPGRPPDLFPLHRAIGFGILAASALLLAWRRSPEDRLSGLARTASVGISVLIACTVGFTGFLGGRMVFGAPSSKPIAAAPIGEDSRGTKGPSSGAESVSSDPAGNTEPALTITPRLLERGEALFRKQECPTCHLLDGRGGRVGPDLTRVARRRPDPFWHIAHLRDPVKSVPGSAMPRYDNLSEEDLRALAAFLSARH